MARFQKFFGGVEIAENGYVKNLVVENLSSDPVSIVPGKLWYNSSENMFKACVVETDDDGNETNVVKTFESKEEFDAFVAKLASTIAGEGSALVGYAGHAGANGVVSVQEGTLEASLNTIVDAIDGNAQAISDNAASTSEADAALQSELDTTQAGAGLAEDGSYTADSAASYIADATTLADADSKLDAALKAEEEARIASDDALASDIATNYLNKTSTDAQTVAGPVDFAQDVYIGGNLTISGGTVTEIVTTELKVGDNVVTLNSDLPEDTAPTETAGIEINRGSEGVMPFIIWDESDDIAKVITGKDEDGNWTLAPIATGGDAAALQEELDTTQAGAGLAEDGSYVADTASNYIAGATSLANADSLLDAQSKANADAIVQETTDRTDADAAIQTEVDSVEAGAGLAEDGSYVADTAASYISGATSLAEADSKLDAQSKANADAIAQEITDRTDADAAIQTEVDSVEAGAGLAEDGSYVVNENANYISGATSLADADNKLDTQVKANADAIAQVSDDQETLKTELNNTRTTFEASDAATSYTITHNLGSQMIDVNVWVYDDSDGKWYNDSVVVSIVDDNTIQVDLTSAAKIRVTIVNVGYVY